MSLGLSVSWKFGADLLGRVMQYLLLWFAARKLGVAAFGDFTFALSIGYMLSQLADFGLQLFVQRELARLTVSGSTTTPSRRFTNEQAAADLVGGGLAVKALLSLISVAMIAGVVLWEPVGNKLPVLLVGSSLVWLTALDYLAYCFRALGQLKQEAKSYIIGRGTNLLVGAGLLYAGADIWGLAIAANLGAALAVVYSYKVLLAYVRPNWKLDLAYWRSRASQPVAMGLGIILSMAAFRVDNLLIPPIVGASAASQALSLYNAGYKLFEITLVIPGVVLAATFPLLCRAAYEGSTSSTRVPRGFGHLLGQVMAALLGLGLIASLTLGIGAVPIVHLLYGDRFSGSVAIAQVLAIGCVPMYASYGLTHALLALNRATDYARITLVALVANIAGNLLLLPTMGVAGAAVATLVTEITTVTLCSLVILRRIHSRQPGARIAVQAEPESARRAT